MAGIGVSVGGALLLAAVSTFGDFIWAHFSLEHRPTYGLIHGALLCSVIGLYLGLLRKSFVRGTLGGAAIGFGAAAGFYGLARFAGMAAMFPLWMALWIGCNSSPWPVVTSVSECSIVSSLERSAKRWKRGQHFVGEHVKKIVAAQVEGGVTRGNNVAKRCCI